MGCEGNADYSVDNFLKWIILWMLFIRNFDILYCENMMQDCKNLIATGDLNEFLHRNYKGTE